MSALVIVRDDDGCWGAGSFATGYVFPAESTRVLKLRHQRDFFLEEAVRAEEKGDNAGARMWLARAEATEAQLAKAC